MYRIQWRTELIAQIGVKGLKAYGIHVQDLLRVVGNKFTPMKSLSIVLGFVLIFGSLACVANQLGRYDSKEKFPEKLEVRLVGENGLFDRVNVSPKRSLSLKIEGITGGSLFGGPSDSKQVMHFEILSEDMKIVRKMVTRVFFDTNQGKHSFATGDSMTLLLDQDASGEWFLRQSNNPYFGYYVRRHCEYFIVIRCTKLDRRGRVSLTASSKPAILRVD